MSRSRMWKLALLWALFIFVLSSIPGRSFPQVSILRYDKVLHAIVYAVFGGICFFALHITLPRTTAVLIAATLAIAYGLTDEFHQLFVPGRSADLYDVVADGVGGLLGASAAAVAAVARRASPSG
jgi:VanZ family protein